MSKNYLCKTCKHNNNGWCTELKKQGLKNVSNCDNFKDKNDTVSNPNSSTSKECKDCEKYRVLGKREMFYYFSRQVHAMEEAHNMKNISIDELKELLINMEVSLNCDEKIIGIKTPTEVDKCIVNDSKSLINHWKETCK